MTKNLRISPCSLLRPTDFPCYSQLCCPATLGPATYQKGQNSMLLPLLLVMLGLPKPVVATLADPLASAAPQMTISVEGIIGPIPGGDEVKYTITYEDKDTFVPTIGPQYESPDLSLEMKEVSIQSSGPGWNLLPAFSSPTPFKRQFLGNAVAPSSNAPVINGKHVEIKYDKWQIKNGWPNGHPQLDIPAYATQSVKVTDPPTTGTGGQGGPG